ncbi:glutathione S-transferase 1-1-like, partial [Lingula anatina]
KAIMPYLLEKYGKNESLYPKDIKQRAIIDRALMFNAITFTPKVYGVLLPRLAKNEVSEEAEKEFKEKAMDKLNRDLEGKQFIAGDNLTIADFAFWGLITLLGLFDIDTSPWSNICSWAERMKALPYYEECHKELFEFWEEMKKVES